MLQVKEAVRVFHQGTVDERRALDGLSLDLKPGDFAVVIGSNGAGKSTLLNAVAGNIMLDTGSVEINDFDVTDLANHRRSRFVSRVFQDPMVGTAAGMTIEENLALADIRGKKRSFSIALGRKKRDRYRGLLASLSLGLEDRLTSKVELLSGGQRQALSLIMAVMGEPNLLLLDEHTAALDPRTAAIVMEHTVRVIAETGLTAIMVTHNMEHAVTYGNRILMMDSGKIKLELSGSEKEESTVEGLIERFHITDDNVLLG